MDRCINEDQKHQYGDALQLYVVNNYRMRTCNYLFLLMSTIATTSATEAMPFKKMTEVMQVKKLSEFAVIPTRGSQYAAGNEVLYDL